MALALEDSGARISAVRTSAIQGDRAVRPWVGRHRIADLVRSHPGRAVRTMAAESLREMLATQGRMGGHRLGRGGMALHCDQDQNPAHCPPLLAGRGNTTRTASPHRARALCFPERGATGGQ
jgi:hypothetical protein